MSFDVTKSSSYTELTPLNEKLFSLVFIVTKMLFIIN
jgi:hypothetical protein